MDTQLTLGISQPHQLPEFEQPQRRLRDAGPAALATTELLALIIGGANALETARDLLGKCRAITDLSKFSLGELEQSKGIGPTVAARIKAAVELSGRLLADRPERTTVTSPADAAAVVMFEMRSLDQEVVRVLLLDTRNRLIDSIEVYRGSLNTSMIRVGELFRESIRQNAASIIVVHNHPSGDPSPSPEDVAVTKMMVEAGEMLDIAVHDHIIIGHGRFISLKECGLGFG